MEPVFEHGQLRLYLLVVLADGPLSGYDIIRRLEDRFGGLYSPSAGTVYPRLAKLEEDGLVERTTEARRSTFHLTAGGRAELDRRSDDVARLRERLDSAHRRLADDMREKVSSGAAQLRQQLEDAARLARAAAERTDGAETVGTDLHSSGSFGAGPTRDEVPASGPDDPGRGGRPGQGEGARSNHDDPFAAFGSAFFGGRESGGGRTDWSDLARWFTHAAARGGFATGPGGDPDRSTPQREAEPPDPWGAVSDGVREEDAADATGEHAGPGHPAGRTPGPDDRDPRESPGSRHAPDPQQWGEIMTILRDAAGRIQDVLKGGPRPG